MLIKEGRKRRERKLGKKIGRNGGKKENKSERREKLSKEGKDFKGIVK
jgi:hypothetical protein